MVDECEKIYAALGDEFSILRKLPLDQIRAYSTQLGLAIERLRARDVMLDPGYDGLFGTIKVFKDSADRQESLNQLPLF